MGDTVSKDESVMACPKCATGFDTKARLEAHLIQCSVVIKAEAREEEEGHDQQLSTAAKNASRRQRIIDCANEVSATTTATSNSKASVLHKLSTNSTPDPVIKSEPVTHGYSDQSISSHLPVIDTAFDTSVTSQVLGNVAQQVNVNKKLSAFKPSSKKVLSPTSITKTSTMDPEKTMTEVKNSAASQKHSKTVSNLRPLAIKAPQVGLKIDKVFYTDPNPSTNDWKAVMRSHDVVDQNPNHMAVLLKAVSNCSSALTTSTISTPSSTKSTPVQNLIGTSTGAPLLVHGPMVPAQTQSLPISNFSPQFINPSGLGINFPSPIIQLPQGNFLNLNTGMPKIQVDSLSNAFSMPPISQINTMNTAAGAMSAVVAQSNTFSTISPFLSTSDFSQQKSVKVPVLIGNQILLMDMPALTSVAPAISINQTASQVRSDTSLSQPVISPSVSIVGSNVSASQNISQTTSSVKVNLTSPKMQNSQCSPPQTTVSLISPVMSVTASNAAIGKKTETVKKIVKLQPKVDMSNNTIPGISLTNQASSTSSDVFKLNPSTTAITKSKRNSCLTVRTLINTTKTAVPENNPLKLKRRRRRKRKELNITVSLAPIPLQPIVTSSMKSSLSHANVTLTASNQGGEAVNGPLGNMSQNSMTFFIPNKSASSVDSMNPIMIQPSSFFLSPQGIQQQQILPNCSLALPFTNQGFQAPQMLPSNILLGPNITQPPGILLDNSSGGQNVLIQNTTNNQPILIGTNPDQAQFDVANANSNRSELPLLLKKPEACSSPIKGTLSTVGKKHQRKKSSKSDPTASSNFSSPSAKKNQNTEKVGHFFENEEPVVIKSEPEEEEATYNQQINGDSIESEINEVKGVQAQQGNVVRDENNEKKMMASDAENDEVQNIEIKCEKDEDSGRIETISIAHNLLRSYDFITSVLKAQEGESREKQAVQSDTNSASNLLRSYDFITSVLKPQEGESTKEQAVQSDTNSSHSSCNSNMTMSKSDINIENREKQDNQSCSEGNPFKSKSNLSVENIEDNSAVDKAGVLPESDKNSEGANANPVLFGPLTREDLKNILKNPCSLQQYAGIPNGPKIVSPSTFSIRPSGVSRYPPIQPAGPLPSDVQANSMNLVRPSSSVFSSSSSTVPLSKPKGSTRKCLPQLKPKGGINHLLSQILQSCGKERNSTKAERHILRQLPSLAPKPDGDSVMKTKELDKEGLTVRKCVNEKNSDVDKAGNDNKKSSRLSSEDKGMNSHRPTLEEDTKTMVGIEHTLPSSTKGRKRRKFRSEQRKQKLKSLISKKYLTKENFEKFDSDVKLASNAAKINLKRLAIGTDNEEVGVSKCSIPSKSQKFSLPPVKKGSVVYGMQLAKSRRKRKPRQKLSSSHSDEDPEWCVSGEEDVRNKEEDEAEKGDSPAVQRHVATRGKMTHNHNSAEEEESSGTRRSRRIQCKPRLDYADLEQRPFKDLEEDCANKEEYGDDEMQVDPDVQFEIVTEYDIEEDDSLTFNDYADDRTKKTTDSSKKAINSQKALTQSDSFQTGANKKTPTKKTETADVVLDKLSEKTDNQDQLLAKSHTKIQQEQEMIQFNSRVNELEPDEEKSSDGVLVVDETPEMDQSSEKPNSSFGSPPQLSPAEKQDKSFEIISNCDTSSEKDKEAYSSFGPPVLEQASLAQGPSSAQQQVSSEDSYYYSSESESDMLDESGNCVGGNMKSIMKLHNQVTKFLVKHAGKFTSNEDTDDHFCNICNGYKTNGIFSLSKHLKKHLSGELTCPECDFEACNEQFLKEHTQSKHQQLVTIHLM